MDDDFALDAILALEGIWREKLGRVTLRDLGLHLVRRLRSSGDAALPPAQWRSYPGRTAVRHEWVEDV